MWVRACDHRPVYEGVAREGIGNRATARQSRSTLMNPNQERSIDVGPVGPMDWLLATTCVAMSDHWILVNGSKRFTQKTFGSHILCLDTSCRVIRGRDTGWRFIRNRITRSPSAHDCSSLVDGHRDLDSDILWTIACWSIATRFETTWIYDGHQRFGLDWLDVDV